MISKKQILFAIGILFLLVITGFVVKKTILKSSSKSSSNANSTPTSTPTNTSLGKNMAGAYIPSWSYYRSGSGKYPSNYTNGVVSIPNLPSNLDYITYAFVLFDTNGNLNWGPNINVFNSDGTINTSSYDHIDFDMIKYIGKLNIKYRFISVGGYNFSVSKPSVWSALIQNTTSIQNLANQLVNMCKTYNLNGVDIDWEYPLNGQLDTFINVAGPILKSNNIFLTLATVVNKTEIDQAYNFPNIDKYFDWYNLMSYDIYGNFPGSTSFGANTDFSYIKDTLDYLINTKNVSSSKISLGLASYGRYTTLTNYDNTKSALDQPITIVDPNNICLSETGSNIASYSGYTADCLSGPYTKTVGYLSYYEIADLLDETNSKPIYDLNTESSYVVLNKNNVNMAISFDTPTNIVNKTKYASSNNLFGVFLWQLADDDFQNNYPIANSAISTIKNKPQPTLVSNRTSYSLAGCGISWNNNNFPLNSVNTCSTFAEPTTVGNGNLSCFGMSTCSPLYKSTCQISNNSTNLEYPPSGSFVALADFLNTNCGSVMYSGSQYGSQFYRDYIQTGRVKMCDCNGNQTDYNPDCSNASDVGACLSSNIKYSPSKAMVCLDTDVNNCQLSCVPQPAQSSTALNADGTNYGTNLTLSGLEPISICSNTNSGLPICQNGAPNPNVNNVYVKDACSNISKVTATDCKQYCA